MHNRNTSYAVIESSMESRKQKTDVKKKRFRNFYYTRETAKLNSTPKQEETRKEFVS